MCRESAGKKSVELPPVKLQKSSDVERQDVVPKRGLLLGHRANKTKSVEPGDGRRHLLIVGQNATQECAYSPGKGLLAFLNPSVFLRAIYSIIGRVI